jgi:hypothetical protein
VEAGRMRDIGSRSAKSRSNGPDPIPERPKDCCLLSFTRHDSAGVMEISSGGSSFKLEGKAGDMKDFADALDRVKAAS